ncbi:MarR family winged helix-turn-helix transcriptional regulator [Actinoplanes sp. GCM10030250]|uniref:MarR family winged helix-turn-helix transcriptional regulator n=1 Tax=Actinoplanes sp. GCM10030250 TaxID=3273376 RepID=UPI00360A08DF
MPDTNKWFSMGVPWYRPSSGGSHHATGTSPKERALSQEEKLIADIMGAQIRLEHLFADDRSDPLFSSHLTMSQLKIMLLLSRRGTLAGGELARMLGVGAATLSGMIDRLVVQDLVTRTEDLNDRRVRRIGLTKAGTELIEGIITAGVAKQRELLSRLSAEELTIVAQAMELLVREAGCQAAAAAEASLSDPAAITPASGEAQRDQSD